MVTKERVGSALFTALCLAIAALDYLRKEPLRLEFLGLVFFAILPWVLPWLSTLFKSLKVGGMELEFRELQNQVQENHEMIQATASAVVSVGRDPRRAAAGSAAMPNALPADAVSHSIVAAEDDDNEATRSRSAMDSRGGDLEDTNLGLFGNKPVAGGCRLSATVKPFPASVDWFMIHAWVSSTDPARPLKDGTEVMFHLHPTFRPPVVSVEAVDGIAVIDRVTWGWFTIGAQVEGVRLGLPLNTVPGAPERFKSR